MKLVNHIIEHEALGVKSQANLDSRYINVTGDTMTGALTIQPATDSLTALVVNDKDANRVLTIDTINNRIGIGVATPTNVLSFGNDAAKTVWIENSDETTVGRALTLNAGSTIAGATTNVAGGNLTLNSGLGKGTGASSIIFQTGRTLTTGATLQTLTTAMTILGSGNVGIGTTNPQAKLHISGTTASNGNYLRIENTEFSGATKWTDLNQNSAGDFVINNNRADGYGNIRFQTGAGQDKVYIQYGGYVGIGTTSPDKKLEINLGTSDALRLTYNDANGSAAVYADLTLSSTGTMTITPVGSAPAVAFAAPARLKGYTVATLPAGVQGDTAFVSDALAPAFLVAVAGGGAVVTTVFHNGTVWVAQ
jgi:hypothetical protein